MHRIHARVIPYSVLRFCASNSPKCLYAKVVPLPMEWIQHIRLPLSLYHTPSSSPVHISVSHRTVISLTSLCLAISSPPWGNVMAWSVEKAFPHLEWWGRFFICHIVNWVHHEILPCLSWNLDLLMAIPITTTTILSRQVDPLFFGLVEIDSNFLSLTLRFLLFLLTQVCLDWL